MNVKINVNPIDRFFRALLGLGLLYLPLAIQEPWAWLGVIGLIPLATAVTGYCPAYAMCGCFKGRCCPCGCKDCSCQDKSCDVCDSKSDEIKAEVKKEPDTLN